MKITIADINQGRFNSRRRNGLRRDGIPVDRPDGNGYIPLRYGQGAFFRFDDSNIEYVRIDGFDA